ncbi:MAG: LuxR C-terminal-related transcriptional regulator [Mycobacteriales bacterium]
MRSGPTADRFAVGAATLSLLTLLSEDRPLAIVIDDAHDLDQPSADAIAFAARRLLADPVVVLIAARAETPCALTTAGLPELFVLGLDREATRALATDSAPAPPSGERTNHIFELSGGNPLAVIELAREGTALAATSPGGPALIPVALAARFAMRADALSAAATRAVRVVATAGADLPVVVRACGALKVDVAVLAEAERAGLLRVDQDRVEFRHPLMRSGVYAATPPDERRRLHAAVANALPPDDDRRTWHLCDAALGPDPALADAVADLAARAAGRAAYAVAAIAYERAARLVSDDRGRAAFFLAAAESRWAAGDADRATALLTTVLESERAPLRRARAKELAGTIAARCGSLTEARRILLQAADETAPLDNDRALRLYAEAIYVCFYLGDSATAMSAAVAAERLMDSAVDRPAQFIAAIATGAARILAGSDGSDRIRHAVEHHSADRDPALDPTSSPWSMIAPLFLRESEAGRQLARQVLANGRARAAVGSLPHLLFHIARDGATTDCWASAAADYAEAIRLAREFGQTTELATSLAGLAWLEARMGRDDECRTHVEEAMTLCAGHHIHLGRAWAQFAIGELQLVSGRAEEAATTFSSLAGWLADNAILDVDLSPLPELVDALLRLGRREESGAAAVAFGERATAKGQPWALARAERLHGMVGRPEDVDRHFAAALEWHACTLDEFEAARTHLAYGSRLRRLRRRLQARPHLRAALEAFERLGALPWADATLVELKATGESVRRRSTGSILELTPQEFQIALLLADQRTTRQAGAALFLSPKTVEYHLRHVYTKLGIRSRTELSERMRNVAQ